MNGHISVLINGFIFLSVGMLLLYQQKHIIRSIIDYDRTRRNWLGMRPKLEEHYWRIGGFLLSLLSVAFVVGGIILLITGATGYNVNIHWPF